MRILACLLLCACVPFSLHAQIDAKPAPAVAAKPVQQFQFQDGGTTEILQSIFIPPKANAPFSLLLQTEWVKTLSDGGTITLVNQRHIARDSKGRIFQERCNLVPRTGNFQSRVNVIQIADPIKHAVYNCFQDDRKECVQLSYTASPATEYKLATVPTGKLSNGIGAANHEDLGKQFIEGVETVGTRDSVTYNPGVFGNDLNLTVERESWYAPALGISLVSIRSDPRIGRQTFRATEVVVGEPDAKLFDLPKGFKVVAPTHPEQPEQVDVE